MDDVILTSDSDKKLKIRYKDMGDGTYAEVVVVESGSSFYSVGYTLNAAGEIASESESNGTLTRTRTWSSVTNPDGSTTFTASAWSYA